MIRIFLVVILGVAWSSQVAVAYEVYEHTLSIPYEIYTIDSSQLSEQFYIGELNNFPEMYEITTDEDFTLSVEIRALPGSSVPQFSGIVVRDLEPRGVEEVARLKATGEIWEMRRDSVSGLSYQVGPNFSADVPAGVYRIEVSTSDNFGKYILVVGNEPKAGGYLATLKAVRTLYHFYDVSSLGMIRSPLIYYPVGIMVVSGLIFMTWRLTRRKRYA